MQDLVERILGRAQAGPARVRLLWQGMEDGAPRAQLHADEPVSAASTIKLPIMLTLLGRVARGEATLEETLWVQDILPDSQPFEQGPRQATLEELCRWMICLSDNTAANCLIRRLGMAAVNDFCQGLGLSATVLRREMLDFDALRAGRDNTVSPRDQFVCYEALVHGRILTPALCRLALSILESNRDYGLLYRYIPVPLRLAHKSGGLDHLDHDAGVFFLAKGAYFLGVFVTGGEESQRRQMIGTLSQWVYAHETEEKA